MQLLPHTPLDDLIIKSLLLKGEQEVEDIYKDLISTGHKVTLQAIYKRLRNLVTSQVILKNKTFITINNEWKESYINLLEGSLNIPKLKTGESIIYSFKELGSLDIYWNHVMAPLEKNFPDHPLFFYNPQEIWIHLSDRRQNEIDYLKSFTNNKRYCFFLLGEQNSLNEEFKKKYQTEYLQVSLGAEGLNERDYPAVIADYIVTTKLSPSLVKTVNNIFASSKPEELSKKFDKIFTKSAAIKLKIERNENKAKKLRKKIAKDFYIPKELKEKFDLF